MSINTIPYHDKIANKSIYLGLKSIKGLSKDLALWIIENRPYSNIEDFIAKLPENYLKASSARTFGKKSVFSIYLKKIAKKYSII